MRSRIAVAVVTLVLGVGVVGVAPQAASAGPADAWMSVTKVEVNKLGGVRVTGLVDCSNMAEYFRQEGAIVYTDESDNEVRVPLASNDLFNLGANSDNYTVSQPAGRRMVQVTHGSSQMTPCYAEWLLQEDGSPIECEADGAPCAWSTNRFGYNADEFGPLFDFGNGKFVAGTLSVDAFSVGLLVEVVHDPGEESESRDWYYVPEGTWATTSRTLRAVRYR